MEVRLLSVGLIISQLPILFTPCPFGLNADVNFLAANFGLFSKFSASKTASGYNCLVLCLLSPYTFHFVEVAPTGEVEIVYFMPSYDYREFLLVV